MINFGHGVELTRLREIDLSLLMEWRNSFAIRKWTRQFDLIAEQDQKAWFARQHQDPTIQMYGVVAFDQDKDIGRLVGVTGLTSIDLINRRAEFSLYIAPECQGMGYGFKALSTLLDHGFRNYGLRCIWGESFDGNDAMKLFERIGFKKEGVRRDFYFRDGKWINAHLYSILASEWLK